MMSKSSWKGSELPLVSDFITGGTLHTKKYSSPVTKLSTGEGSNSRIDYISVKDTE